MILSEELAELGVSMAELARAIDVPPGRISEIVAGKRAITGDTALRLGHWFGTSAQFWLNLQVHYDLTLAAQAITAANMSDLCLVACVSAPRAGRISATGDEHRAGGWAHGVLLVGRGASKQALQT